MSHRYVHGVCLMVMLGLGGWAFAQDAPVVKDRELLDKQRAALGEAFNRSDAAAWAAVYAPDAELIRETGEVVKGPAAIQKLMAKVLVDNKGAKVTAAMTSERVLTPQIVLEDGTYRYTGQKDGAPSEGRYTTVWVHRNGRWLLVSHRAWVPVNPPAK